MFLYYLKPGEESQAFLELAAIASQLDGKTDEDEDLFLYTYKFELNMLDYRIKHIPYEKCVEIIKASNNQAKRSIVIELSSILYSDKEIDDKEDAWIMRLSNNIGLGEDETKRMISWSKDFADFIEIGLMYINHKKE
jgi:hypothetical protein